MCAWHMDYLQPCLAQPRSAWDRFVQATDDDVLSLALGLLLPTDILCLAATSTSVASRLAGGGVGGMAERVASAHLGRAATVAARTAALSFSSSEGSTEAMTSDEEYTQQGDGCVFAALRALVSLSPASETLRHAMAVTAPRTDSPSEGLEHAHAFLDKLFQSEVRGKDGKIGSKRRRPGTTTLVAADAALTSLLTAGGGGSSVMLAAAKAVRDTERELDNLVDEGHAERIHNAYEDAARRRSAVEFLRQRLGSEAVEEHVSDSCDATSRAKDALDVAVGELDETILGYTREGYDFSCPRLLNSTPYGAVPYAHWWIFLGRAYSEGWAAPPPR